jgi:hypothetical protein
MQELDQLIKTACENEGKQDDVNKVYLTLLKTLLWIPIQKTTSATATPEEPFSPLFMKHKEEFFMAAFSSLERLQDWAGDQYAEMEYVELSGREVINGINENVYLCLNINTPFYKEFSPEEIKRLKMIVARIAQLTENK